MPAPPGKDGAPTAKPLVPKEYLRYFEGRGRRLAVIGARDFACNVAARPTSYLAAGSATPASGVATRKLKLSTRYSRTTSASWLS
jgi:hypothetical protein